MYLEKFIEYLKKEKKMAQNSQEAYKRDVLDFFTFIKGKGVFNIEETTKTEIVGYLFHLKDDNKSASTLNRKLASLRAFFTFLIKESVISENPATNIKAPKVEKKEIEYLSVEEVDELLSMPEDISIKGKRDKAILEILYATGVRVNEIIGANINDINLRIGFFTCTGESGKARIVPMGRPARVAAEEYIYNARDMLIKDNKEEKALFVNYYGNRMTRQGLWKILKEYGKKAGLTKKLTPHILRNSFAVHMVQNGADLKSLQELLGHEDPMATQMYLSVTKNRIKDVYDKTHPRA